MGRPNTHVFSDTHTQPIVLFLLYLFVDSGAKSHRHLYGHPIESLCYLDIFSAV